MNYYFKNNNIYYGDILVAEDMRDATKRLNELEDMLIAREDVVQEFYYDVSPLEVLEELKTTLLTGEYPTKMVEE